MHTYHWWVHPTTQQGILIPDHPTLQGTLIALRDSFAGGPWHHRLIMMGSLFICFLIALAVGRTFGWISAVAVVSLYVAALVGLSIPRGPVVMQLECAERGFVRARSIRALSVEHAILLLVPHEERQ